MNDFQNKWTNIFVWFLYRSTKNKWLSQVKEEVLLNWKDSVEALWEVEAAFTEEKGGAFVRNFFTQQNSEIYINLDLFGTAKIGWAWLTIMSMMQAILHAYVRQNRIWLLE